MGEYDFGIQYHLSPPRLWEFEYQALQDCYMIGMELLSTQVSWSAELSHQTILVITETLQKRQKFCQNNYTIQVTVASQTQQKNIKREKY